MNVLLQLQACAANLRAGIADPAGAGWLTEALHAHQFDGAEFGAALGLDAPPSHEDKLATRDHWLQRAWQELDGSVRRLGEEIDSYHRAPAADRKRSQPPAHWSTARKFVHRAVRMDVGMPATRQGLHKALARLSTGDPSKLTTMLGTLGDQTKEPACQVSPKRTSIAQ